MKTSIKKEAIFFLCLIFLSPGLFATPYDMILTGDPILEDLRFISLESGIVILSFTAPLAPHEVELFLDRIDVALLSTSAKEAYYRVRDRLTPASRLSLSWDKFSLFFDINATLEARIRSDTDIDWYPVYPKIPAFLSLPLRFHFADTVQFYIDPSFNIDPYNIYNNDENYMLNTFFGDNGINGNSPLRSFIAAGGSWWNFQLGRDRLSYGTGLSGNLGIADNPPYYEFMRLSFFSKYFKYSLLINQTPLEINDELYQSSHEDNYKDLLIMTTQRYFYLHRIDFVLFNVLSVGIMEGVIIGNSALELRHLNPLAIFHNMMTWRDYDYWNPDRDSSSMIGSFFSAEINWNITKSLAFYGQFVMNELAINNELNEDRPTEPPNGLGYMAGLQYSHSFNSWGSLFFLECIYTYPYLYLNSSPFSSIIFMHKVGYSESGKYYYYFGYPRDTLALTAGAKFFSGNTLIIDGQFSWISRGKHGGPLVWDWERTPEAYSKTAPSGIPENNLIASIGAEWKILPYLTLKGNLVGIFVLNNKHEEDSNAAGIQACLSVSLSF
jgi:hypothetical protein